MARRHDRKRQLKLQKTKNKRALARRKADARALPATRKALIARALDAPFGPCWVTECLDDDEAGEPPALITVVVTRRVGGLLLPSIILVDRTCLGIKNAFVGAPCTELELEGLLADMFGETQPVRKAELLLAQSVIFHAIDFAGSLGFRPHRDFVAGLVGERPAELLDTPLARPERPIYVPGPDDDIARIIKQLDSSAGPDNYDILHDMGFDVADLDDDDFDEDDFDDDELEASDAGSVLTVEGTEKLPSGT